MGMSEILGLWRKECKDIRVELFRRGDCLVLNTSELWLIIMTVWKWAAVGDKFVGRDRCQVVIGDWLLL